MAKSTNSEKDKRVTEVYTMLIHNKTRSEILQYGSIWGITDRQIDSYISDANQIMLDDNAEERHIVTSNRLASLKDLYNRSYEDGDFKECRAVIAEINKIEGNYAPTKTAQTDVKGNDIDKEPETKEELKLRIEKLKLRKKELANERRGKKNKS